MKQDELELYDPVKDIWAICIEDNGDPTLITRGCLYKIDQSFVSDRFYDIINDNGRASRMYKTRFILLSDFEEEQ
uniref:Uncharacterized protein n=2 Tax=viral metagenome TaxID=1070528 RepID=A0A6H1ZFV8_9ZZZZ